MNEIISESAFRWFLTAMVGIFAGVWLVYDVRNLVKLGAAGGRDALARDKRFGYVIGIVISLVGIVGVLHFHEVL